MIISVSTTKKTFLRLLTVFAVVYFLVQIFFYHNIYYNGISKLSVPPTSTGISSDLAIINKIASALNLYVHIFDDKILSVLTDMDISVENCNENHCPLLLVAVVSASVDHLKFYELQKGLHISGFFTTVFYNEKPSIQTPVAFKTSPVGLLAKRAMMYYFLILYSREDNTWWFGNMMSDNHFGDKIKKYDAASIQNNSIVLHEGILNKFATLLIKINGSYSSFLRPKYLSSFFMELRNSNFIECNTTRATLFHQQYITDTSREAKKFRHLSWKLLTKVKTVFENLSIPFWLSSGTCLGYFRECNIISYSKDVDIGVFARDYHDDIIDHLEAQNIRLHIWFGEVEDSLELSFLDPSGLKLDIFFFYKDGDFMWNGGTQEKSGKKFKRVLE